VKIAIVLAIVGCEIPKMNNKNYLNTKQPKMKNSKSKLRKVKQPIDINDEQHH
jgi:hypothetical protein